MSEREPIAPMDSLLRQRLRETSDAFDDEANAHARRAFERLGPILTTPTASAMAGQSVLTKLTGPIVASALIGAGVGAAVTHVLEPVRDRIVYVDRTIASDAVPSSVPSPTTSSSTIRVDDLPASARAIVEPSTSAAASVTPSMRLEAERLVLDEARSAFASGDYAKALAILRRYEGRFHGGVLAEERDALAIRTLAALGRKAEATASGRAFVSKYPESIMRPAVESAIADQRAIP